MQVLVFRSNIESKEKTKSLEPLLDTHKDVINWSIDHEDWDNVIRIVGSKNLTEADVINMIRTNGFYIEPLLE